MRCSSRCSSISLFSLRKYSSRSRSSSLIGLDRAQHGAARRDVVRTRIDGKARDLLAHAPGQRVEQLQRFDLVVEHLDPDRQLGMLGREDVDGVAAHAEGAAAEIDFVARVLHLDQARDDVALRDLVLGAQGQDHLVVFARITDTVNGRHGGDDDHVAPLHQRLGARQAHLLDMLVDRRVLFDEQVALRHVGFRLVVIVVADEILDRVLREELAELRVQLRRQRLVRREHDGRPAGARDHVRHRVGLAGTGHAEQRLERQAVVDAFDQAVDRGRLVAGGREGLVQLERRIGKGDDGRRRVVYEGYFCHKIRPLLEWESACDPCCIWGRCLYNPLRTSR